MNDFIDEVWGFNLILDRYNGVTISSLPLIEDKISFENNLLLLIQDLQKEKRKLLWITFSLENAHLIEIASKQQFTFHNCGDNYVMMVKKLTLNPIIPTAPTHTLGVGVVVINEKKEILLIKERFSNIGYKLPGGHIDLGEKIETAACREVLEETGITVEFESVITLSSFYPHQFGKGNIYILCKAIPKSDRINIQDTDEILEAKWMNVDEFLGDVNTFEYVKEIIQSSYATPGLKHKELDFLKDLDIDCELFFPINVTN
ncbi:NUDIX domain-containing protein [Arcobacter sp. HD9-500m-PIT-SAG02]|nr:NUDIX domain-containing protein [Arcobacter sp. HD9-500m-PIT-SAG02]